MVRASSTVAACPPALKARPLLALVGHHRDRPELDPLDHPPRLPLPLDDLDPVEPGLLERPQEHVLAERPGHTPGPQLGVAAGKVEPGEYRAYGYKPPGHLLADLKLRWREWRTSLGVPPTGSSPAAQQKLGLNRDITLYPKRSTSEQD
jgi:hypothetical protein